MFLRTLACCLAFFCLHGGTIGQADKGQQPASAVPAPATALDAQFRKFEELSSFVRARNARDYAISTANGIDEGRYVTIGGIEQWITIRGEDRRNPVLLFLHGGPGDVKVHRHTIPPLCGPACPRC